MNSRFFRAWVFLLLSGSSLPAEDWPRYRGPTMGIDRTDLPLVGREGRRQRVVEDTAARAGTKAKFDHNQSSPIVWKDRVSSPRRTGRKGNADRVPGTARHVLPALDGKLRWDTPIQPGREPPISAADTRRRRPAPTTTASCPVHSPTLAASASTARSSGEGHSRLEGFRR